MVGFKITALDTSVFNGVQIYLISKNNFWGFHLREGQIVANDNVFAKCYKQYPI